LPFTSKQRKDTGWLRAKSGKARYILPVFSAKVEAVCKLVPQIANPKIGGLQ
jgi:hypothetical protein